MILGISDVLLAQTIDVHLCVLSVLCGLGPKGRRLTAEDAEDAGDCAYTQHITNTHLPLRGRR